MIMIMIIMINRNKEYCHDVFKLLNDDVSHVRGAAASASAPRYAPLICVGSPFSEPSLGDGERAPPNGGKVQSQSPEGAVVSCCVVSLCACCVVLFHVAHSVRYRLRRSPSRSLAPRGRTTPASSRRCSTTRTQEETHKCIKKHDTIQS